MAVVLAAAAGAGILALAAGQEDDRVPRGVRVDGVDLGHRTVDDAVRYLDSRLGRYPDPVEVEAGGRRYAIRSRDAGARIDYRSAIMRALARRGNPGFLHRAWRELTSPTLSLDEHAPVQVDPRRARRSVARLARSIRRSRRDATLTITPSSVAVRHSRAGVRVAHPGRLVRRVIAAFRDRRTRRLLHVAVRRTPPRSSTHDVLSRHPTVVTVARRDHLVRVFRRGHLVAWYHGRAGVRGHRTPAGRYTVGGVQRDIAFHGAVGFRRRGTGRSSGAAARSVRMGLADLRDLGRRVRVGTLVVVGG
jgi:hypothetical protein